MKIFRNICLTVLTLLVVSSAGGYLYFKHKYKAPPNQLQIPGGDYKINFTWKTDSINGKLNPHAALLLPVTIVGCPKVFYMQFDTGAPYTLLYKGKLAAIAERTAAIKLLRNGAGNYLKDFEFKVGQMPVRAKEIEVLAHGNSSVNWTDNTSIDIIGTIGTDLIDAKVLVLNYPHNYISLSDSVPATLEANVRLVKFNFDERRVVLPATINHNKTKVLFDSGSSAFELLTDNYTWQQLAKKGAGVDKYEVNSWGNTLTVHSVPSDRSIDFGPVEVPLQRVHYLEGTTLVQRILMRFSGMGGMVGNKLLLDKVLVLDSRNQRFGIAKER